MLFQKTILASLFAVLAFASATSATPFGLSKRDCNYACPDSSCNDRCQASAGGKAVAPICQDDIMPVYFIYSLLLFWFEGYSYENQTY
ncbi:hypothetical protein PHYBLDRAFT_146558 [Phycomyces blakesleeanus NRRL 1555(-)]|uniref:Uncharacterized protein n=1 Tax=Phycomyces blakesleeanus (strain ATCC 8743b / DSM 1359 / FGSC 10004 / NBRC 33097 / NRRL 1555) TaxID=763407 RepID=A0A167MBG1_PHYB8|nr:hypothetical protein PHYBLDRAFT_146558 [Phycomyces blakesleeanus NRRL 1555(-)]OAD72367.1 hypothetical protein PHYBLDRAFT_146558 [Phycomyces blakesleeanus NRRL 1555(-)]|eukprot:XP_018290407.1 hypothetical protein PHYBLDRAFT_146558 [Phycomyces blakesleeanus NRRL 1555(-)]